MLFALFIIDYFYLYSIQAFKRKYYLVENVQVTKKIEKLTYYRSDSFFTNISHPILTYYVKECKIFDSANS